VKLSSIYGRIPLLRILLVVGVSSLVWMDIAARYRTSALSEAVPVSQLKSDGVPADYATRVAIVRSDDSALAQPAPLDEELSAEQIHAMVAEVLDLSGDLRPLLFDGAKISIKPNVVEVSPSGDGVNTDARVVEGIILWLVDQGIPNLEYTITEGAGGWLAPEMRRTIYDSGGAPIRDGFQIAGYRDVIDRLEARGIKANLVDADFGSYDDPLSHIRLVPVPDCIDFPEWDEYWIHDTFLDPDLLINVPVMKTHSPHITACLKNHIGLAAGARYGTYKGVGGPNPGDPPGLHKGWPEKDSVIREILDLAAIARPDYNVVDAIVCKEKYKSTSGTSIRRNIVLAGPDMVAVDTVCARLMGLNPADVDHVCRAAREGLGTNDPDRITIVSEKPVEDSVYYFEHSPRGFQSSRGYFGRTPPVWLLNRVDGTDLDTPYLGEPDAGFDAEPGMNGWTEPILFSDVWIDFQAYYGAEDDHTYYAFCWIDVPRDQEAELWIDHDEDCVMWIGGEEVYRTTRRYRDVSLPERARTTIQLKKGRHPLLVKLVDTTRNAVFVFNICDPVPDSLPEGKATYPDTSSRQNAEKYAGNRVAGLKFDVNGPTDVQRWGMF